MRAADITLAFPEIIIAILVAAMLGPGIVATDRLARGRLLAGHRAPHALARAVACARSCYIDAAIVSGTPDLDDPSAPLLPNIVPALIVRASVGVGFIIMAEATLSFLGLGVQEPRAELGRHDPRRPAALSQRPASGARSRAPRSALTIVGFNLLGDGLRDILDPRGAAPMTLLVVEDLPSAFPSGARPRACRARTSASRSSAARLVGLVGESGSGKSVTALAIMGLLPPK